MGEGSVSWLSLFGRTKVNLDLDLVLGPFFLFCFVTFFLVRKYTFQQESATSAKSCLSPAAATAACQASGARGQ